MKNISLYFCCYSHRKFGKEFIYRETPREKEAPQGSVPSELKKSSLLANVDRALANLDKLEKPEERIKRKLLEKAEALEKEARESSTSDQRDDLLQEAQLYREAVNEPIKTRRRFYALVEKLKDMQAEFNAEYKALSKGKNTEQQDDIYQTLFDKYSLRMQRYVKEKFGNGAQLELARKDLVNDFHRLMDFADGDEAAQYLYTQPPHMYSDADDAFMNLLYGKEGSINDNLVKNIYNFWKVTQRYWAEKSARENN